VVFDPSGAQALAEVRRNRLSTGRRRFDPESSRIIVPGNRDELVGAEVDAVAVPDEAASVGANVVLVRSRQVVSRHDPDCPGASVITDCPPGSGAWFDVVVERYACTQEALRTLGTLPGAQRSGGVGIVHRSGGR